MADSEGSESLPWCRCCRWNKPNLEDSGTKAMLPRRLASGEEPTWLVASGTKLQANHQHLEKRQIADFLVRCELVAKADTLALEFKSNVGHVSGIVNQLHGALDLVSDDPAESIGAVLVHSGKIGVNELRQLKGAHLTVRGKRVPIQRLKSGESVEKMLP